MDVYGLDFTSAPSMRKPITCARCRYRDGGSLAVEAFEALVDFAALERLLATPGPWIAGLDFPFGQPRRLLEDLRWTCRWTGYVRRVSRLRLPQFERLLRDYCDARPSGQKFHLRAVDRRAGARSPMMLHGVPVGKMFFRGAPRLLASPACVLPCRRNRSECRVVEAYPALVARRFVGRNSYKNDAPHKQTPAQREARRAVVNALRSRAVHEIYGIDVQLPAQLAQALVADATADRLDALLCAIQAAWAWTRREAGYGMPAGVDRAEGWIVDPILLSS
ncbi:MAG: DUF429 domain-containing protein [Gammaproteobacteria bacterium]|nr:DUF429 domain-containing protein [Gammaproteobacteria bacterium]NIR83652.1 DUF429 domain-containing protein [Gammaproteobacteria bacterium]NIR91627.1 DUF429 domain-containing protein [Gammaproteobacteria bacterium]NIU04814.1 DUF429 domain-containing protein [Gammaproteobacteria bacterium]NIV51800.1 DUF429 domain-containing protein [Gammaproteobacteria bacterium]